MTTKPNQRTWQGILVAIGALVLLAIYLCAVIVRIENERYALLIGMCHGENGLQGLPIPDLICLEDVQTRTNALWHIYYAITD